MRHRSGRQRTLGGIAGFLCACLLAACSADDSQTGSGVGVTIEPDDVTVVAGTSQPFVAAVTGTANSAITWSLEEGRAAGAISPTGVYRASNQPGTYHVVATSQAQPSSRRRATLTVIPRQEINVAITSPAAPSVTLPPGGSVAFLATVTGAGNRNVTWIIETGRPVPGGSIDVDGLYTAPPLATALPYLDAEGSINVIIRARSMAEPSRSATRPVVIQRESSPFTVSPPTVVVGLGGLVTFTLSETLFTPTTWTVNNVAGGNSTVGTISTIGGYAAPFLASNPTTVTIGNSAATNAAAVTVVSRFLPPEAVPVQACFACRAAQPVALAGADFNSDGLVDLATANSGSGTLSVLMAADSSHFAAPYRLPVGSPETSVPKTLVSAWLNGAGPPALVAVDVDGTGAAIRARLGRGDGTFDDEVASALPANADPVAAASGAFDADSLLDLVVADASARSLHLFQGLGGALFSLRASVADAVRIPRPTAVAVGDFDRNGRDDLAVAVGDHTISVWLTDPDGSVRSAQTIAFQPGSVPVAIIPVDLNMDAAPDLVVTFNAPPGLSIVLNSGAPQSGRFGAPSPAIAAGSAPASAATGDFNNDGFPDLVVADPSTSAVTTFFGDGRGALVQSESYRVGLIPDSLTTGDINGDGWDDVVAVHSRDDAISILRNRGGPTAP